MKTKIKMLDVILYLKDSGVNQIRVEYSGGGDSGEIDAIRYINTANDHELDIRKISEDDIHGKVENYCYKLLDGIEDWYNNEGGWGEIIIDLDENTYEIYNNIRITESELYEHSGNIDDHEED